MIKIIDNFFENKKYNQIINHIKTNIFFKAQYLNEKSEKSEENYYGDRFVLEEDENLLKMFIKQSENKFKIKIKKLTSASIDIRNLKNFFPHTDTREGNKLNIFIMLDGPVGVTTGIVFYTNNELDMHVGFRPNRALLFPSDKLHSPHKSDLKGIRRYTSTLFIKEYGELI